MRSPSIQPLGGVLALALTALLSACSGFGDDTPPPATRARFAVLSDTHVHDAQRLGASGPDFEADLARDRKMWADSGEIMDATVAELKDMPLDFVLVTGDLTKDGERLNHDLFASKLKVLREAGKQVFVIPGNHDVNNPEGKDYTHQPAIPAERTTPQQFQQIYADCGYARALYRDPDSLSYVAEPVQGLWLIAMDSCRWKESATATVNVTAGALPEPTRSWILDKLKLARMQGKTVIGAMHHGLVEHFPGQAQAFPEYLVADREAIGRTFLSNGLNTVFTGHYHAQDVSQVTLDGQVLTDIETGSLVTAPCPWRAVDLDLVKGEMALTPGLVKATKSHPTDFQTFAASYLRNGLTPMTRAMLIQDYHLDSTTADQLTPVVVASMMAHHAGDERLDSLDPAQAAAIRATLTGLTGSSDPTARMLGGLLQGIWSDATADGTVRIPLRR